MIRAMVLVSLTAALLAVALAPAPVSAADELGELKARFKKRYPVLKSLRASGKVGETFFGRVEAVESGFAKEKADPSDEKSPTVGELVAAENEDRVRLFAILAEKTNTTPEKVAERNGARNREKAGPEEWLKTKDGKWVKKKDWKDEE